MELKSPFSEHLDRAGWAVPTRLNSAAFGYEASAGGEATPVTQGRRHAHRPFLYDDATAPMRDQNRTFVGQAAHADTAESVSTVKSTLSSSCHICR